MPLPFGIGLKLVWISVLLYWVWGARHAKPAERAESLLKCILAYWLPLVVALLLLGPGDWFGRSLLREQFVPHTTLVYSCGLALCVAGASLAIWSRHLLGQDWSGGVQLKQGQRLISSGPYRLVRHPIYSGLLLLFVGNAVMVGDWRGLLAVAIVFMSFWRKLKLEEKWLTEHFGETYRAYQQRTKMLVPAVL